MAALSLDFGKGCYVTLIQILGNWTHLSYLIKLTLQLLTDKQLRLQLSSILPDNIINALKIFLILKWTYTQPIKQEAFITFPPTKYFFFDVAN